MYAALPVGAVVGEVCVLPRTPSGPKCLAPCTLGATLGRDLDAYKASPGEGGAIQH